MNKIFEFNYYSVLDSSGTSGSGFIFGNNFWLGSVKQCEYISTPTKLIFTNTEFMPYMHNDLMNSIAPINIGYRVIHASHTSAMQAQVETFLDRAVSSSYCQYFFEVSSIFT